MKEKWTYERLGDAIDALLPILLDGAEDAEEARQAYHAAVLATFAEAGWTEEEYDIHIEQILEARWAAEKKRVGGIKFKPGLIPSIVMDSLSRWIPIL